MTDYQDALVLENLDLVNWVIRTRISIPNRPLLTYDDFYAIGCEAICRAALKYQPDMGAFAPFACRYIYNAIVDHCRAMNYRLERSVEISEDENASLLDMLTCTSVDFDETVTDATAMSALAACKEKYNGVARKGVEAIEMKLKGYEATEIAKHYDMVTRMPAMIISIISASLAMMLSWKLSGVSGRESCSWAATQLAKHPTSRSCLTTMLRVLGHPKKTEAKVSQIMSVP